MKVFFLYIFWILFSIISNDEDDDYLAQMEADKCASRSSSPNTCREVILTNGRLCCEIWEKNADNVQETCEMKTTYEDQMLIVGSSEIINKEQAGLAIYNDKYGGTYGENIQERKFEIQRTITITCSEWKFSVDIVKGEYSEEEINILKSDHHCLSYYNPYLKHTISSRRKVTRDTCYKASLLPSTRESGISCGYMEIDFEEPNFKKIEKRITCFLYDSKVVSSKTLDEATRLNLNDMTRKKEYDDINYNFTIYGPNGNGYTYSSKTRKVEETMDDPSNYDYNKSNHGIINKLSNYFVILIILYFYNFMDLNIQK